MFLPIVLDCKTESQNSWEKILTHFPAFLPCCCVCGHTRLRAPSPLLATVYPFLGQLAQPANPAGKLNQAGVDQSSLHFTFVQF